MCVPCYSTSACTCINYIKSKSVRLCGIELCVSVWLTCVCECVWMSLYIIIYEYGFAWHIAAESNKLFIHESSLRTYVCLSVSVSLIPYILLCLSLRLCFYMNMVACKSKEFRAFTALSLSQSLPLCLFCLLCFSLGMWLSPWPVVRTYAVGQNDHKSQEWWSYSKLKLTWLQHACAATAFMEQQSYIEVDRRVQIKWKLCIITSI